MPVDVSPAEKKLREARFFFEALTPLSYARTPEGPSEHFEFYLSAFLSASKSISDKLGRVAGQTTGFKFTEWRKKWEETLEADELAMLAFMRNERDSEVHHWGRDHEPKVATIAERSDDQATKQVTVSLFEGYAPFYTVGGEAISVLRACRRLCELLDRMILQFKADHP
jgi:hypothetical protein